MLGQATDVFACFSVFWLLHPIEVCVFHFHPFADPPLLWLTFPKPPDSKRVVQTRGLSWAPFWQKDTFGRVGLGQDVDVFQ